MTETAETGEANAESNQESSPSTEASTGEPQTSNLEDTGFKYGAGAPPYLQGKTATEAIDFVNNLVTEAQQLYQAVNTPQAQPAVQPQISTDPDLWLTDPEKAQAVHTQQIMGQVQNYVGQAAQPLLQSNAQTARHLTVMQHTDVFDKWGHEVDQIVANVPIAQRSPELYNQAVKMVKANHVEELAQERAQQLMQAGPGLEAGGQHADPFAATDAEGNDVWSKFEQSEVGQKITARLTKRQITELCDKAGIGIVEYADMVARNTATIDPDKGTITNSEIESWEI